MSSDWSKATDGTDAKSWARHTSRKEGQPRQMLLAQYWRRWLRHVWRGDNPHRPDTACSFFGSDVSCSNNLFLFFKVGFLIELQE